MLDKYRVARKLGEGGFGRVYAAEELTGGRAVALKVGRSVEDAERMAREARLASLLQTPHAVRVLGFERLPSGRPVIVMELLEGLSLREYLTMRGRVEPRLALEWARQLAEALKEAHALGLFHRDLKPSNVFLAEAARGPAIIKLLDFGLARAPGTAGEHSVTDSELVLGSPAYMSPEQIRSEPVGVQSDIWSFGIVLYEMLAGQRPFRGESNAALLAAIVADEPEPLEAIRPSLSPELHRLVARCLGKRPASRFASIEEVLAALDELRASDRAPADACSRTITETRPAGPPRARSPRVFALGLAGILSAAALAGFVAWNHRAEGEAVSESSTPPSAPSAVNTSVPAREAPAPLQDPPRATPPEPRVAAEPGTARPSPEPSPAATHAERPARAGVPPATQPRPSVASPDSEPAAKPHTPSREAANSEPVAPKLFFAEPDF